MTVAPVISAELRRTPSTNIPLLEVSMACQPSWRGSGPTSQREIRSSGMRTAAAGSLPMTATPALGSRACDSGPIPTVRVGSGTARPWSDVTADFLPDFLGLDCGRYGLL